MSRKFFASIGLIAVSIALTISMQVSKAQIPQQSYVGSECNGEPPEIFGYTGDQKDVRKRELGSYGS